MSFIHNLMDLFLHLDEHLNIVIQDFGVWTYLILFLIIFAETGLVVTPFLPGDSLLFAIGAFAGVGTLNLVWLLVLLSAAAIMGDSVNYAIGKMIGPKVFTQQDSRIFKKEYLDKTHQFYEKYGGKTIIIARFVPIVRTFAPFVAGVGQMSYGRFLTYNVVGGLLWVVSLLLCGYFFGNIPIVKENFTAVIYIIIAVSIVPAGIEFFRHRRSSKA